MAVGEKSKRKKTTVADLPEELVRREILTRLPIKSAVRFKCVSKSWLSLFSNPQFVKHHLIYNSTQNPNDYYRLITMKKNGIIILSRYKETLTIPYRFDIIGSVGGLVCLCCDWSKKLCLWNPAIHQSKEFALPPSRSINHIVHMGLVFDPVINNYKVVVLSWDLRSAIVYCSNSDSWIDVCFPHNLHLPKRKGLSMNSVTIIKNCPYWKFRTFARDSHNRILLHTTTSLILVKFDVGSNELKLLPRFHFDTNSHAFGSEFVDMNDFPTLIVYAQNSSKPMLDMYSLNGEEGCCVWSKMYNIGPLDVKSPRYWFLSHGFNGSEIIFYDKGLFSCYDCKTSTIKRLRPTSTIPSYVQCCFRYTPSLVFLDGMKSVYLPTQTRGTTAGLPRVPRCLINSLA